MQILQDFDQDPEVAEEFAAVAPNGTRNIPWAQFCRGRADADQLAQALLDGTADTIPHAVWGPVSTADAAGHDRDTCVIMYVARNPHRDRPVRLRVAVRCDRPDWIGVTTRSSVRLRLFPDDLSRAQSQCWIELQLWVIQPWQVAHWDTEGTTVDLPKPVVRPRHPKPAPDHGGRRPDPSPTPDVPPPASPEPESPATLPPTRTAAPAAGAPGTGEPAPEPPADPAEESGPPAEPPRPPRPPLPPTPPLPPFPPPGTGEVGRRSALGRWLHTVRRRRN